MPLRRKSNVDRLVEFSARDVTVLAEQVMALRTEVRDALTRIETETRAQERAKAEARAAAERSRRYRDQATASLAGKMAAEAAAPVVGQALPEEGAHGG